MKTIKKYITPIVKQTYFNTQELMTVSQLSDKPNSPGTMPAPRRTTVF